MKLEGKALCPEGEEFSRFEEAEKGDEDGESQSPGEAEEKFRDGMTAGRVMGSFIPLIDLPWSLPSEDGDEVDPEEVDSDLGKGAHDGGHDEGGQQEGECDGHYRRGGGQCSRSRYR